MDPKELKESSGTGPPIKDPFLLNFGSSGFESWEFLADHKILN